MKNEGWECGGCCCGGCVCSIQLARRIRGMILDVVGSVGGGKGGLDAGRDRDWGCKCGI